MSRARVDAFLDAMREAGIALDPSWTPSGDSLSHAEGVRLCRRLLEDHPELTAMVVSSDLLALGCLDALAEAGIACPADVSVVGFNDMPFADRFNPPLTTIRYDHYGMGVAAARMIVERLGAEPEASGAPQLQLEASLVVRGSTAPPRSEPD
jgi:LacI family transcriptional regulator